MFEDRSDAGRLLAGRLLDYLDSNVALVLALPRGGAAVGFRVAERLGLPLDVFITRKLRSQENPEFAVGALTETGYRFVNPDARGRLSGPKGRTWLVRETEQQQREIERNKALYRGGRDLPAPCGRTVLLVDDGIATGSTLVAAVRGLRPLGPKQIVIATPVAAASALDRLRGEADHTVAVHVPRHFRAVGEHYSRFAPVEDREVVEYLAAARKPDARRLPPR